MALSLITKGTRGEGNRQVLANNCAHFHFALIFISALKYYFQRAHHLIWKIIITVIIVLVLRAFIVKEGKCMPLSPKTHAFLGPVGLIGEFSLGTTGKISTSQNPLLSWALFGLVVDSPRRESSGSQTWAIC